MFCEECGSEIKESVKFCPECGYKIIGKEPLSRTIVEARQEERLAVIGELEAALNATTKMEEFVKKQERLDNEKVKAEKKYNEIYNEMTTPQFIAGLVGLGIFIQLLVLYIRNGNGFLSFIFLEIFFFGSYCVLYYAAIKTFILLATDKKRTQKALTYYEPEMARIKKDEDTLMNLVQMYMESNEFKNARDLVPEEYFDSVSINYILKLLNDKRADSFKEAVNLYEDYLYKEHMKQMQMQQIQLQNDTLNQTKQLANDMNVHMQNRELYMQNMAKDMRTTAKAAKLNTLIAGASAISQSSKLKKIERNTR